MRRDQPIQAPEGGRIVRGEDGSERFEVPIPSTAQVGDKIVVQGSEDAEFRRGVIQAVYTVTEDDVRRVKQAPSSPPPFFKNLPVRLGERERALLEMLDLAADHTIHAARAFEIAVDRTASLAADKIISDRLRWELFSSAWSAVDAANRFFILLHTMSNEAVLKNESYQSIKSVVGSMVSGRNAMETGAVIVSGKGYPLLGMVTLSWSDDHKTFERDKGGSGLSVFRRTTTGVFLGSMVQKTANYDLKSRPLNEEAGALDADFQAFDHELNITSAARTVASCRDEYQQICLDAWRQLKEKEGVSGEPDVPLEGPQLRTFHKRSDVHEA